MAARTTPEKTTGKLPTPAFGSEEACIRATGEIQDGVNWCFQYFHINIADCVKLFMTSSRRKRLKSNMRVEAGER